MKKQTGFTLIELLVVLAILIITLAGGVVVWENKITPTPQPTPTPMPLISKKPTPVPSISNFNFYPIHEIKQAKLAPGNYNTEGYVVKIFTCPPCPTGAQCKPCMGENIVVSEENKILNDYYSLTDKDLFLFVQNAKQFALGKKYQFSLKVTGKESSFGLNNQTILDIKLLGYQEAIAESCEELESQIATLLEQANYCQKNSDCKLADIPLGCPFGCYRFVNKNEDLSLIKEGAEKYQKNCNPCIYRCTAAPKPEEIVCRNNKCLDIRFVTR